MGARYLDVRVLRIRQDLERSSVCEDNPSLVSSLFQQEAVNVRNLTGKIVSRMYLALESRDRKSVGFAF
jgi:hypothetical protein